jgi:hypothetical protein
VPLLSRCACPMMICLMRFRRWIISFQCKREEMASPKKSADQVSAGTPHNKVVHLDIFRGECSWLSTPNHSFHYSILVILESSRFRFSLWSTAQNNHSITWVQMSLINMHLYVLMFLQCARMSFLARRNKRGHLPEDVATAKDWYPFKLVGDEISLKPIEVRKRAMREGEATSRASTSPRGASPPGSLPASAQLCRHSGSSSSPSTTSVAGSQVVFWTVRPSRCSTSAIQIKFLGKMTPVRMVNDYHDVLFSSNILVCFKDSK